MKALITLTLLLSLGLVAPVIAADQDDVEQFENRVKQLNTLGEKPGTENLALQRISTETGVPLENVRTQHKRHPNIGVGGLMVANVLSNETGKPTEHFLSQRASGKKWLAMAKENKVTVEKLNQRLDRLARAIKGDKNT
jgi:hypothetical protein